MNITNRDLWKIITDENQWMARRRDAARLLAKRLNFKDFNNPMVIQGNKEASRANRDLFENIYNGAAV